ncbi:glycosyltransferase [Empedobacter sp.]|uniref:glycosyltransferase n=1 Tax=Empedobacter sp. TaxID=1927715 RepID=UPI0028AC885C|nr:glycosyltransferase [Empedobacter sp.]
MILLDALYINNSGGKVLLDYLVKKFEESDLQVFYLFDIRLKGNYTTIKEDNHVLFLEASIKNRKQFYKTNKDKFSKVFCFGNLPPNIKLNATVYTYLHQTYYLEFTKNVSFKFKALFMLKRILWKFFSKNTDFWIVQTNLMQKKLSNKIGILFNRILVLPFYEINRIKSDNYIKRNHQSFLYVSNAPIHKNHEFLINGFCKFYDVEKSGSLTLTISKEFPHLLSLIEDKKQEGYPIYNVGFVDKEFVTRLFQESEYTVYPSLTESFGLGLIEGIENGCKIIGADLPYTYAVCKPSLVFNPNDVDSLVEALKNTKDYSSVLPSSQLVENKIDYIIELFKK